MREAWNVETLHSSRDDGLDMSLDTDAAQKFLTDVVPGALVGFFADVEQTYELPSDFDSINDYGRLSAKTAVYRRPGMTFEQDVQYLLNGLVSEVGELAGLVKRITRDDDSILTTDRVVKMLLEAGDVLWYLVRLICVLGVEPSDVIRANVLKLHDRWQRGKLRGDGDAR